MGFGTWPRPRVEVVVRCFRSELGDEVVGGLAKTTEGRERDGFEVDVKVFVLDDFVGRTALVVGVDVGGGTTGSLTRRVVDVGVDGGVRDADVQDRLVEYYSLEHLELSESLARRERTGALGEIVGSQPNRQGKLART